MNWKDWLSYLDSDEIRDLVLKTKGNWENYIKAAILKLQYAFRDRKLKGMNMAFSGDIPMAAGLSSSSAMVVASAEAAIAVNGLDVQARDFVDLCGEGEWFVGSRGGAGDHAAMKFGDRGHISRLGFFPFGPKGRIPFPPGLKLVIADSRIKAQKTTNAKDVFNQRIASYEIGLAYFVTRNPDLAERIKRLRDINPENLMLPQSEILARLKKVPEAASLETVLRETDPRFHETVRKISASHTVPEVYPVRSVLLYGIAECRRSALAGSYLEKGDLNGFGRMMYVSHDGDRVVQFDGDGAKSPFVFEAGDTYLDAIAADLRSEVPDRVAGAQLEWIPGGYACSVPETDFIVDLARTVPGVYGAQLSGAGLGGCVMVLVREEAEAELLGVLRIGYYEKRGLEPSLTVCSPVKGSMILRIQ
jgi:N-acetylgalactosamine kinase